MSRAPGAAVALLTVVVLTGCASTTISGDEEAYRGQLIAAVAPVRSASGTAVGARERGRIQSQLVSGLAATGIFASVTPLSSVGESNEAEVIIEPSIAGARYEAGRLERIQLRVEARRKSTGETGLDDSYKGRASRKGDAASDATKSLVKDLDRVYGEKPIY